jgi:hypothetical protein
VKGKDFATTLGPVLVTPEELEPHRSGQAYDLTMTASVNGREYSRASLADIYWSFGQMLAYASRGTELVPGDVIGSGTCGTGCILELSLVHGAEAYPWLSPGDVVTLEVEQLGRIQNAVVEGSRPKALWRWEGPAHLGFQPRLQAVEERLSRLTEAAPGTGLTDPDEATGERWDWGQVWAHVAEFPAYWIREIRRVMADPRPQAEPPRFGRVKSDPERVGAIERDRGVPAHELMNRVRPQLREVRGLIDELASGGEGLKVAHPTLGLMDMERVLDEFLVGHLEAHADQLDSLIEGVRGAAAPVGRGLSPAERTRLLHSPGGSGPPQDGPLTSEEEGR